MVTVITDEIHPAVVNVSYSWWRVALIGAVIGAIYWVLSFLIGHFIIDPMFCRSSVNAAACSNSVELSGNIAGILVATLGLMILVWLKVLRPLVVAVATAIILWGLAGWTAGLVWVEVALWSVLLYSLSYVLFSWMSRYGRSIPVLVAATVTVVIARIILTV